MNWFCGKTEYRGLARCSKQCEDCLREVNNKLIDEFMGGEFYVPSNWDAYDRLPCAPLFDVSWDWLMPVVEKIESLGFYTKLYSYTTNGKNKNIEHYFAINKYLNGWEDDGTIRGYKEIKFKSFTNDKSKLKATYKAVVEFIKWYNNNKNKGDIK